MKKLKIFFLILLGFVLGACAAVGVYFLTVGDVAWHEYVETKLAPNIMLALTTISSLAIASIPIISKVQDSLSRFNKATEDINDTVGKGRHTQESIEEQDKRISKLDERFNSLERKIDDKMLPIEKATSNTEDIVRIGFCNMEELVKKGYATEIEKVGVENEQEETES